MVYIICFKSTCCYLFSRFRKDAVKEADEILILPINLRITAFEKMLRRLLAGTKYSVPQHGNRIVQK
jgi:hypothetical protein